VHTSYYRKFIKVMIGGRRREPEIRRDSLKVTLVEPDTHNKITRCGVENAPMITVIIGPYLYDKQLFKSTSHICYRDNGDFKNDTARVAIFLRLLRERGFDLNVMHLFDPAAGRPTPHDSKSGYTGFLQVMYQTNELFYCFDAQHLRHVHNLPALARDMVRDVHAAFRQCIAHHNTPGEDEEDDVDAGDGKMAGDGGGSRSGKSRSFALGHEDSAPLERDTHDKILRCGKEGAPLLSVYLCPYKYY
jgi:hypothetical protein